MSHAARQRSFLGLGLHHAAVHSELHAELYGLLAVVQHAHLVWVSLSCHRLPVAAHCRNACVVFGCVLNLEVVENHVFLELGHSAVEFYCNPRTVLEFAQVDPHLLPSVLVASHRL